MMTDATSPPESAAISASAPAVSGTIKTRRHRFGSSDDMRFAECRHAFANNRDGIRA
jgi:hypothetical protein